MKNSRTTPIARQHAPRHQPLPLDLETAPAQARKPVGYRAYIGGILYLEGIIVFLLGLMLLMSYWPPVEVQGQPANPISRLGLWLVAGALIYMVAIGAGIFFYNLLRPAYSLRPDANEPGYVRRARRYACMKRRTYYVFDDTVCCEHDADEAMQARALY